ncbi:proteasome regulatory particle base subunit [Linderina macrospora]|uniref:Proteasome regulatory particle base subunit n=1 Tax=Linderina macrospora TaxID=4868 RepID=A0ACC1J102_9FUNG|nr:proteasome regulatory particle base subunit [Linderina macrospora]
MRFSKGAFFAGLGVLATLIGSSSASLSAKSVKVRVTERTGDKLLDQSLVYPKQFTKVPTLQATTPLSIAFEAQDADKKAVELAQAFVSFQHASTGAEVAFAAKMSKLGSYKLDITRKQFRTHLDGHPGEYKISLVLGSFEHGGLFYPLGSVKVSGKAATTEEKVVYGAKPEIHHQFAEAQKMPSIVVSLVFAGLTAAPLVGLLGVWAALGVNAKGLGKEPVGSAVFLGLVTAYMGLAVAYWVGVKLFPTLTYAAVLALPTYLAGQYTLSKRIEKNI